jgi:integrase
MLKVITPALGARRVTDIRRRDVQAIVDRLVASGAHPSSVRNAILPLRVIFRRAIRDELVTVNPTREVDLPAVRGKRDRIATPEQARELIDTLPRADRVLWGLAFYAGLRRGELLALRWGDVDVDAGRISVERAWCSHSQTFTPPKSAAGRRVIPAASELRRLLLEHRLLAGAASRDADELVITGRFAGVPASASQVNKRAGDAWRAAELDALTLHEARHTYASLMIAAGVGFKQLQTYMGHSSITVTLDRYGHRAGRGRASARRALGPLRGPVTPLEPGRTRVNTPPAATARDPALALRFRLYKRLTSDAAGEPSGSFQDRCVQPLRHPAGIAES